MQFIVESDKNEKNDKPLGNSWISKMLKNIVFSVLV